MTRILVAYASKAGSTQEIAEAIGKELAAGGTFVEVLAVQKVKDVTSYDAVVVGSGIRAGLWYDEAVKFLRRHQVALSAKRVAYFVVCLTLAECTERNRRFVSAYVEKVKEKVSKIRPVDVAMFGGVVDLSRLGVGARLILKAANAKEGDWRDWDAIRAWAVQLREKLL